jgi:PAT family beta-lactamase induction signal transducer AmpG
MLFLGFSAGLPLLLIFSSLSLWLREAGLEKSSVTYFSWAALGYSFKFVWAPLVDCLPIPFLTRPMGMRRSWLLCAQISIVMAITIMAISDPSNPAQLSMLAFGAVLLGFSSATQDICIDAYRIEAAKPNMQGYMSASYVTGYRIGMIVAGAGALYLASYLGTTSDNYIHEAWQWTYHVMSAFMLIGIVTTLAMDEPIDRPHNIKYGTYDYFGLVVVFLLSVCAFVYTFFVSSGLATSIKASYESSHFVAFLVELIRLLCAVLSALLVARVAIALEIANKNLVRESYINPVKSFFNQYGLQTAWLLLALVGLYRISDIVLGVISNVFYQDLGFSKTEIADAVKVFGLVMSIVGAFLGGSLAIKFGVMRSLYLGGVLVIFTNLLFIVLYLSGPNIPLLYTVVAADNLVAGLASAAFVAFLSRLVNVQFTAMQYAIFSSLMTLMPKLLGGYSGSIVENIGYTYFFLFASALGIPVLILIVLAARAFRLKEE